MDHTHQTFDCGSLPFLFFPLTLKVVLLPVRIEIDLSLANLFLMFRLMPPCNNHHTSLTNTFSDLLILLILSLPFLHLLLLSLSFLRIWWLLFVLQTRKDDRWWIWNGESSILNPKNNRNFSLKVCILLSHSFTWQTFFECMYIAVFEIARLSYWYYTFLLQYCI